MNNSKIFNRDFNLVVIGQIISLLGSAILRFAINLYVLDITGRADVFSIVLAISFIPYPIFSPIGGAIADRFNRRNLMVIFDFTSSGIVLIAILALLNGVSSIVFITIILTLLSLISAMYQPAVQASIPVLVKEDGLEQANGIVSGVGALSGMIGPVLGGALYGIIGLDNLLVISCIAFAFSAVMEIFIHIPFVKMKQSGSMVVTIVADLRAGIQYMVNKNRVILKICILAAGINFFLSSFLIVGTPYILRITMKSSDTMYAVGMALAEASTIVGALSMGLFSKRMKLRTLYKWLYAIAAMVIPMAIAVTGEVLSFGYLPSFILYFLFAMLIMVFATIISIYVITQVQKETPNEILGKIMAIIMAVAQCAVPLGQMIYGFLIEKFSGIIFIPILIMGVATAGIGVAAKKMLNVKAADNEALLQKSGYEV